MRDTARNVEIYHTIVDAWLDAWKPGTPRPAVDVVKLLSVCQPKLPDVPLDVLTAYAERFAQQGHTH